MKRKILFIILTILSISAVAVYSQANTKNLETPISEEIVTKYDLTEKQTNILKNINIDKELIKNGEYTQIQQKIIEQYNYADNYLKEKYPSYNLEICDQKQKKYGDSISSFSFIDKDNDNKTYIVYLYKEESGYYAIDNFWGHLVEDEFSELISKKLNKFNSIKKVTAKITGLNGYDFNESLDANNIVTNNIKIKNNIRIELNNNTEDYVKEIEKIEEEIRKIGIDSTYHIRVYDNDGTTLVQYDFSIEEA